MSFAIHHLDGRRPSARQRLGAMFAAMLLSLISTAAGALEVTGSFTGWWGQPDQENHGVIVSVSQRLDGSKLGVLYWANYDEQGNPNWFYAEGPIEGDRISAELYRFDGVTFMQPDDPASNAGELIGTMNVQFDSCKDGNVDFTTPQVIVGTGGFRIKRLTNQPGTICSGGVSDNTPPNALPEEFEIQLVATGAVPGASGKAEFESRAGRADFSVDIEDLPVSDYLLFIDGTERGVIQVVDTINGPEGEIEFRSPAEPGKELLDFDPRGKLIEILDGSTVVLESVAPDQGDIPGSDQGNPPPFGDSEIEVSLINDGSFPAGSGDAEFEQQDNRVDFDVEIEDVPVGDYGVSVGGVPRGTLTVLDTINGTEGEIEFRYPAEPGKAPLDFDPRGELVEIFDGATRIFSVSFPGSATGGDDDSGGDDGNPSTDDDPIDLRVTMTNTGVVPGAFGAASFERDDEGESGFEVEIEDVPDGSYVLQVDGAARGTIEVIDGEGEIDFGNPADDDELLLGFDVRGATIEVFDGAEVILTTDFP